MSELWNYGLILILDIGAENVQGSLSKKKYMTIADAFSTTTSKDIARTASDKLKGLRG